MWFYIVVNFSPFLDLSTEKSMSYWFYRSDTIEIDHFTADINGKEMKQANLQSLEKDV